MLTCMVPMQRFQFKCQAPAANDQSLFAKDCLIQADGNKCLKIDDAYDRDIDSYATKEYYSLTLGDCSAQDRKQKWNVVNRSKCFTPANHLIRQGDQPLPGAPEGY